MHAIPEGMSIGPLARAGGVTVETVRFYQRRGLLREPAKHARGIRRYGQSDLLRLRYDQLMAFGWKLMLPLALLNLLVTGAVVLAIR